MTEKMMTEREEWLKERRTGIGSSDAAVILGANPWKSPFALWAEKTGLVEKDATEPSEAALWGNILEPVIADQYALRTGRALKDYGRHTIQRNPRYPFAHATIDREIAPVDERGPGILEIKTVSLRFSHLWEEEAPLYYQIQLQHQFMVTGTSMGHICSSGWRPAIARLAGGVAQSQIHRNHGGKRRGVLESRATDGAAGGRWQSLNQQHHQGAVPP